jgi:flagellar biogenesis protein FliO
MEPDRVLLFIIGTIVVLFGAYYVTYYIGMKASGQTRAGLRNRNIKILDRYSIARDKQFCIIEIADKVYIIGIANHTMTLLDTLDAAAFAKLTEDNVDATPWNMTPVGQYGNKLTRKLVAFIAEKTGKTQKIDNQQSRQQSDDDSDSNNDSNSGSDSLADFAASLREAERAADGKSDNTETGQPDEKEED